VNIVTEVFGTKWSLANTYYPLYKNKRVFQTKCNRKVFKKRGENRKLTFLYQTSCKGITSKTRSTRTDWIVIHNLTASIETACAWTWILTFLVDTGQVLWAVRTDNTLRPACGWGTHTAGLTRAHSMTVHNSAHTVRTTWAWQTGVCRTGWSYSCVPKMKGKSFVM